MLSKLTFPILLIVTLFLTSCGDSKIAPQNSQLNEGMYLLNNRNYKEAIKVFEGLARSYPTNSKYKQLLADSYLGSGGFELFDFIISIETLISASFNSEYLYLELKNFINSYKTTSRVQKGSIVKALSIYSSLGDLDFTQSKEGRLKKGLVHIYLLSQSLKSMVEKIQNPTFEQPRDLEELKLFYDKFTKKYVGNLDEMIFHSFEAYFNLQESYREVHKLIYEIDRSIEVVFGRPLNRIRNETENMNIAKFVQLFLKYNPAFFKEVVKTLFQTCDRVEVMTKLKILETSIYKVETSSPYKGSALKTIAEMRTYIETRSDDLCDSNYIFTHI